MIENGQGQIKKVCEGFKWKETNKCNVVECNEGYKKEGNSCVEDKPSSNSCISDIV